MTRPPLELAVSLRGPGGQRYRLAPTARSVSDRPLDLSFSTEAGEGFSTGQITLKRQYDQEFPDLALLNEAVFEGYSGDVAYEGRTQGTPRSLAGGGPEIRLDCQGWMSHARQQPFVDLIVDRDLSQWGEPSAPAKAGYYDRGNRTIVGPTGEGDSTGMTLTMAASTTGTVAMACYRAPAATRIAQMLVRYTSRQPGGRTVRMETVSSEGAGSAPLNRSSNIIPSANYGGIWQFDPADRLQFARIVMFVGATSTTGPADEVVTFEQVAVIGDHGLTISGGADPTVSLSDVIQYLAGRYAPKLDLSQIVPNTFPIPHAVWREPVTVADAIKQLNVYSQWALGVWENRQLQYQPFDLSTYDWEVQAGINGVEVETQGVTVESAFNGVIVKYTDWAGVQQIITPDQTEELQDPNPAIAANQWGERSWTTLDLSNPQSADAAVTIGRLYLADLNRPKFPSTITVPGHIRDRHGRWQQAWRVRANQTISVRNHPNDAPRLITSTSWQGNQLQITTDNALNRMEAILGRLDAGRNPTGGN